MNVADITLIPAMPGTTTSSRRLCAENTAPNTSRRISGSRTPKNAALGLRQNIRRSRRNCLQALAARQGAAGELGQQRGRVLGHVLDGLAVRAAVGHAVARRAGAERPRR